MQLNSGTKLNNNNYQQKKKYIHCQILLLFWKQWICLNLSITRQVSVMGSQSTPITCVSVGFAKCIVYIGKCTSMLRLPSDALTFTVTLGSSSVPLQTFRWWPSDTPTKANPLSRQVYALRASGFLLEKQFINVLLFYLIMITLFGTVHWSPWVTVGMKKIRNILTILNCQDPASHIKPRPSSRLECQYDHQYILKYIDSDYRQQSMISQWLCSLRSSWQITLLAEHPGRWAGGQDSNRGGLVVEWKLMS